MTLLVKIIACLITGDDRLVSNIVGAACPAQMYGTVAGVSPACPEEANPASRGMKIDGGDR